MFAKVGIAVRFPLFFQDLLFFVDLSVFFLRFFFKQKTAYEISACLVGSEMCIRDRLNSTAEFPLFDPDARLPGKNGQHFVLLNGYQKMQQ